MSGDRKQTGVASVVKESKRVNAPISGPSLRKMDVRAMRRLITWLMENNRRQEKLLHTALEIIDKSVS